MMEGIVDGLDANDFVDLRIFGNFVFLGGGIIRSLGNS
jgi:hypothetical protein